MADFIIKPAVGDNLKIQDAAGGAAISVMAGADTTIKSSSGQNLVLQATSGDLIFNDDQGTEQLKILATTGVTTFGSYDPSAGMRGNLQVVQGSGTDMTASTGVNNITFGGGVLQVVFTSKFANSKYAMRTDAVITGSDSAFFNWSVNGTVVGSTSTVFSGMSVSGGHVAFTNNDGNQTVAASPTVGALTLPVSSSFTYQSSIAAQATVTIIGMISAPTGDLTLKSTATTLTVEEIG
jgi:hypothetical protein